MGNDSMRNQTLSDGIALVLSKYGPEVFDGTLRFREACCETLDANSPALRAFLGGCDARLLSAVGEYFKKQDVFSQEGFNAACARLSYVLATEHFKSIGESRRFAEELMGGVCSYVRSHGGAVVFSGLPNMRLPESPLPAVPPHTPGGSPKTRTKDRRIAPLLPLLIAVLATILAAVLGFFMLVRGVRVTFDVNGATSSVIDDVRTRAGESFVLPTNQQCQREGYQLVGWSLNPQASIQQMLPPGSSVTAEESCTYYAFWCPEIRFEGGGATSGMPKTLTAGLDGLLTMPPCGFSWQDHTFVGWSTSDTAPIYQPGEVVSNLHEPAAYYARWTTEPSDSQLMSKIDAATAVAVQDGHTYALFDVDADWWSARNECLALGGHLATITSGIEQGVIEGLFETGTRNTYWLGGELGYSGDWKWVTGEPFGFANWAEGAPDNYRPEGRENDESLVEEALSIYRVANPNAPHARGSWNDLSGDGECNGETFFGIRNIGYICEWDEELVDSRQQSGELSVDSLPRNWTGVYEGYSQYADGGVISRSIRIDFQSVSDTGGIEGTCTIGVNEVGDGAGEGSYEVRGSINWKTGAITLTGSKWIDQGDLVGMRTFTGVVDPDTWTIGGSSEDMLGSNSHSGDWWMAAY